MNPTIAILLFIVWLGAVAVLGWALRRQISSLRSRRRLASGDVANADESLPTHANWLARWLHRAGFRRPRAVPAFLVAMFIAFILAGLLIAGIFALGVINTFNTVLRAVPGGVGEVFLPLAWIAPWLAGLTIAALPAVFVHSTRRRRVESVDQDLPVFLDLLSTLAEAGLSFDAAVDRILESQREDRPLASDLRLFQLDIVGGRSRLDALIRLRERVDVAWFSVFVSALIHAEQVGAGLARTLRLQAEDLRVRRRERALEKAMQIPVKLVFPLVVCFLPGIFVATLGPIALQLFRSADALLRGGGAG